MLEISLRKLAEKKESQRIKRRYVIDELLPASISAKSLDKVGVKKRDDLIDLLSGTAESLEQYVELGKSPSAWVPFAHKWLKQYSRNMKAVVRHLEAVDSLLTHPSGFMLPDIRAGLLEQSIDPTVARDVLNVLHTIAADLSKPPPKLRQGNTKTAVGLYTLELWRVLNALGIRKKPAGKIIAQLLIATVHRYSQFDVSKLAESCYQIIRSNSTG